MKILTGSSSQGTRALAAWNWAYTVDDAVVTLSFGEIPTLPLGKFVRSFKSILGWGASSGTLLGHVNDKSLSATTRLTTVATESIRHYKVMERYLLYCYITIIIITIIIYIKYKIQILVGK